jgi:uroporphyrin-3 C-methyltransferase
MSSQTPGQSLAESQVPVLDSAPAPAASPPAPGGIWVARGALYLFAGIAAASLVLSALLWQKLSNIQEQLARQSQEAGNNAVEARAMAKQAQELVHETAARQAVLDTKFGEVALQRSQVEDLVQSLSRSRDENLLVDIEAALRLAQQQAQVTGSAEPLLAALRAADQRLERAGQPRLSRVRAAVLRDIDRIKSGSLTDLPGVMARLDELARQVDELPVANAVAARTSASPARPGESPQLAWWKRAWVSIQDEARSLVRVSRIDQPEAALIAPEQSFFLRENLKLKLLNARLAILTRQTDSARADVISAIEALRKYFDGSSRRTQAAIAQLQQVQGQLRSLELPRVDETLAVLSTAAAGK